MLVLPFVAPHRFSRWCRLAKQQSCAITFVSGRSFGFYAAGPALTDQVERASSQEGGRGGRLGQAIDIDKGVTGWIMRVSLAFRADQGAVRCDGNTIDAVIALNFPQGMAEELPMPFQIIMWI